MFDLLGICCNSYSEFAYKPKKPHASECHWRAASGREERWRIDRSPAEGIYGNSGVFLAHSAAHDKSKCVTQPLQRQEWVFAGCPERASEAKAAFDHLLKDAVKHQDYLAAFREAARHVTIPFFLSNGESLWAYCPEESGMRLYYHVLLNGEWVVATPEEEIKVYKSVQGAVISTAKLDLRRQDYSQGSGGRPGKSKPTKAWEEMRPGQVVAVEQGVLRLY